MNISELNWPLNFSCTSNFNGNFFMQSAYDYGSVTGDPGTATTGIGFSSDAEFSRMIGANDSMYEFILPRNLCISPHGPMDFQK